MSAPVGTDIPHQAASMHSIGKHVITRVQNMALSSHIGADTKTVRAVQCH